MDTRPTSRTPADIFFTALLALLFVLGIALAVFLARALIAQSQDDSPPKWARTCVESTTTFIPMVIGSVSMLIPIESCLREEMVCKAGAAYTGTVTCQGPKPDTPK